MTKPNNPTAFPINDRMTAQNGMTLRDYFAAKIIAQIMVTEGRESFTCDDDARLAYVVADAMLKAREAE